MANREGHLERGEVASPLPRMGRLASFPNLVLEWSLKAPLGEVVERCWQSLAAFLLGVLMVDAIGLA